MSKPTIADLTEAQKRVLVENPQGRPFYIDIAEVGADVVESLIEAGLIRFHSISEGLGRNGWGLVAHYEHTPAGRALAEQLKEME